MAGSMTGSMAGSMTGRMNGSMTGSMGGSLTGSMVGSMAGSMENFNTQHKVYRGWVDILNKINGFKEIVFEISNDSPYFTTLFNPWSILRR